MGFFCAKDPWENDQILDGNTLPNEEVGYTLMSNLFNTVKYYFSSAISESTCLIFHHHNTAFCGEGFL